VPADGNRASSPALAECADGMHVPDQGLRRLDHQDAFAESAEKQSVRRMEMADQRTWSK
jgi:hypothetical protein